MSAQLHEGELLPQPTEDQLKARHGVLVHDMVRGVVAMCVALYHIRAEETYRCDGMDSFKDFLARMGISETNGRRYANCGPMLEQLAATGDAALVRHPDMLRPIAGMLTSKQTPAVQQRVANTQAKIVRTAAARSRRELVPLDEALIADVAERNFRWLPPAQYRKRSAEERRRRRGPVSEEVYVRRAREDIERAIAVILGYGTGGEVVERVGGRFVGFQELADWVSDVKDSEL